MINVNKLKKMALLLLLVCHQLPAGAQVGTSALLWEVSVPGGNTKSYLFATFHEVNSSFFLSQANAVKKLNEAAILFVEETFDSVNAAAVPSQFKSWSKKQWENVLTVEQFEFFPHLL